MAADAPTGLDHLQNVTNVDSDTFFMKPKIEKEQARQQPVVEQQRLQTPQGESLTR